MNTANLVSVTERTCIEPYDGGIHYTEDGGANWTDLPADTVVSMNLWGFTPGYVAEAKAGFVAFLKENLPVNPLKCEYYLPSVDDRRFAARRCRRTCADQPRQVARHHLPRGQARTGSRPAPDERGRAVPQR